MENAQLNRAGLLMIAIICFVLVSACARKQVYIPPEYSSPPPQAGYSPPSQPRPTTTPASPAIQTPEFRKQDLPESPVTPPPAPAAQPKPQQTAPQQAQKPKPAQPPAKEIEAAQSPQRQASMQLVNQARGPLERAKPDSAIPLLEKAIKIDARNGEAFLLLAKAWKQKGQKKKAVEFAKKAELLYQGHPAKIKEVHLLESELYREMGENTKAGQHRDKASGPKKPAVEE